jgi:hypothetical protein
MKHFAIALSLLLCVSVFTGCFEQSESADKKQAQATHQLMEEANRQVGMPNIKNFTQKKLMKLIQELCDQADLVTYTYIKNEMTGQLVFLGESVGYGVPFSAQFTNPERIAYRGSNVGIAKLPQPDPNGLFMPTSSSATWVMLKAPDGTIQPTYIESDITVSTFKLTGPAIQ